MQSENYKYNYKLKQSITVTTRMVFSRVHKSAKTTEGKVHRTPLDSVGGCSSPSSRP